MSRLLNAAFIDLYLGKDFFDVRGLEGAATSRSRAPADWHEELTALRAKCSESFQQHGEVEFSVMLGGQLLRVTKMTDITLEDVYFIRKPSASIRDFEGLAVDEYVFDTWREKDLRGVVLIAGEMANGKTSTAYGMIVDRMKNHGGLTIAIEDPSESMLTGEQGLGRVVQVQATKKAGGYTAQMYHAMRTGADLIFLGEIRDAETAAETIRAGINGQLILATIHGGSPSQAIERLITLGSGELPNAAEILAQGLSMVVWQQLERTSQAGRNITRMISQSLVVRGTYAPAIREKIRQNNTRGVMQEVEIQRNSYQPDDRSI